MWYLPKQKVSKAEKTDEWKNDTIKHFTSYASFYTGDKSDLVTLYEAASGILNPNEYKYVLNPYNSEKENIKKFPAQMRNIDIISPILKLFLGEKAERPDLKTVICTNSDSPNKFTEHLNEEFKKLMYQDFVNQLNELGLDTGNSSQQIPTYEQFVADKKASWRDSRAIMGQEALDYLRYDLDLKDKFQLAFKDWTICNRAYTFKYILNNDVKYKVISALELWHGSSDTGFIEDSPYAVRKFRLNVYECLDLLASILSEKDVEWLSSKSNYDNTSTTSVLNQTTNIDTRGDSRETRTTMESGLIDIFHVNFKTFEEYGILTYIDEFGKEQTINVDGDYVLDEELGDISIEWLYGNVVYEGYQIEDRVLIKSVKPVEVQRNELNNHSVCKLQYNGRIDKSPSIVKTLLNYQALINIYHFRAELTLARNKDKIMLMPKGLLPDGWEPDKAMYFAEATGLMWFDETKPNAAAIISAIRSIDMGLGTYVAEMRNLLKDIKEEAWDSVGMNRQRYGDTNSSDGKGVNQDAINRSATITREHYRKFEKLEEKDFQGLLDYSKQAWKKGKKGSYIKSDNTHGLLDIDGDDYQESELGVFAKDSTEEFGKLQTAKSLAGTFAQKGTVKSSTILEIIDSNNISKLKGFIKKAEDIEEQLKQQQEQLNRDSQEKVATMNNETSKIDSQTKLQVANIAANAVITSAQIKADSDYKTTELSTQETPEIEDDNSKINELRTNFENSQKNGIATAKNQTDARLKEQELKLKEKDIDNKLKIAKDNKNKYDK